jgi:hypothetical protein
MKHWHPFVGEAVQDIVAEGADEVIGLVLAPHYPKMSIGGYEQRLRAAKAATGPVGSRSAALMSSSPAGDSSGLDRVSCAMTEQIRALARERSSGSSAVVDAAALMEMSRYLHLFIARRSAGSYGERHS